MKIIAERRSEPGTGTRERWIDLVRALALVRVIVFHAFGNPRLITVVAAVPLMLVIGGKFTMRSLERSPVRTVLMSRLRRVGLPGLAYLVAVGGVLLVMGAPGSALLRGLATDLVPGTELGGGPAADRANWLFSHLWYIRDYLLFVAMSPLLALGLRRWRRWTLAATAALFIAAEVTGVGAVTTAYLVLWICGMAFDLPSGTRARRRLDGVGVGLLVVAGIGVFSIATPDHWTDPLSVVLLGLALVAVVQFGRTVLDRMVQVPDVTRIVVWMNQRAVTIYLWHMVAVVIAFALLGAQGRAVPEGAQGLLLLPITLVLTWALVVAVAPIERRAQRANAA